MRASTVLPEDITPEAFVLAWQRCNTLAEVSAATGMDRKRASQYAGFLRKKGVPLKDMKATYDDYSDLVALAQRAGEEKATP